MDLNKDLASLTRNAALDQAIAGMETIAKASGAMFAALKAEGFSAAQAFEMVKQWQAILLTAGSNRGTSTGGQ